VTSTLARANFAMQEPEMQDLPDFADFITHHIDPLSGDDDTADIDADTGNILSRLPPLQIQQPAMPDSVLAGEEPVSRNAPCPCGSGMKYKHCHGQLT
jgi:preprotein translocase subunit SecA